MSWLVCWIYYSVIYDILKHSFVRFGKKWFIIFLISQIVCFLGVRIFSIIFFSWQNAYRFSGPVILLGLSFIVFHLQSKRINFPCLSSIRFLVCWSLLILNNILVIGLLQFQLHLLHLLEEWRSLFRTSRWLKQHLGHLLTW